MIFCEEKGIRKVTQPGNDAARAEPGSVYPQATPATGHWRLENNRSKLADRLFSSHVGFTTAQFLGGTRSVGAQEEKEEVMGLGI